MSSENCTAQTSWLLSTSLLKAVWSAISCMKNKALPDSISKTANSQCNVKVAVKMRPPSIQTYSSLENPVH
jgi:hypothetical protein